jgi:hypothetical protein
MVGVKVGAADQMVLRQRFKNILGPSHLNAPVDGLHVRPESP